MLLKLTGSCLGLAGIPAISTLLVVLAAHHSLLSRICRVVALLPLSWTKERTGSVHLSILCQPEHMLGLDDAMPHT